mmetsp:Transcript_18854/g.21113  ORF Transcript_18854/g.21113 Transcript_18854/m.21113 type:complete len:674 (-) Transcript_18854:301-2322(-)
MPPKKKIKSLATTVSPTPFDPAAAAAAAVVLAPKVVPPLSAGSNNYMGQNQHYQNQNNINDYNGYSGVASFPHNCYPFDNQYTNGGYGQPNYSPMSMQLGGYNYWYDRHQQNVPSLSPTPPPPSSSDRGAFTPVNVITPKLLRKLDGTVDELLSHDMFVSYTSVLEKNGSLKGESIVVSGNDLKYNSNFVTKEDVTGQGGRWLTNIIKNTTCTILVIVPRHGNDDGKMIIKAKKYNAENNGKGTIKFWTLDLFIDFLASQPAKVVRLLMIEQELQHATTQAELTILQKQSLQMKQQMYLPAMAFAPTFASTNAFVLQAAGSYTIPQVNSEVNPILSIVSSPLMSSQDNRYGSCRRDIVATVVATGTQKITKSVITTADVVGNTNNIGNDNRIPLKLILSFILAPQKEGNMNSRLSKEIAQDCSKLPCVNTRFRAVVRGIMNGQLVETTGIENNSTILSRVLLSPNKLATIKSITMQLDLQSIQRKFIYDANETWGEDEFELVAEHFTGSIDRFVKLIEKEYRYFLVVKSVETLICNHYGNEIIDSNGIRNIGDTSATNTNLINGWIEKCQPSNIVDKYWHSHMLSPKLYEKHCTMLVGEIIDHKAMYISPKELDGSDYKSKKNFLFQFEEGAFDMSGNDRFIYYGSRIVDSDIDIKGLAENIAGDMNEWNDCG